MNVQDELETAAEAVLAVTSYTGAEAVLAVTSYTSLGILKEVSETSYIRRGTTTE